MEIKISLDKLDALLYLAQDCVNARKVLFGDAGAVSESYRNVRAEDLIKDVETLMVEACANEAQKTEVN